MSKQFGWEPQGKALPRRNSGLCSGFEYASFVVTIYSGLGIDSAPKASKELKKNARQNKVRGLIVSA